MSHERMVQKASLHCDFASLPGSWRDAHSCANSSTEAGKSLAVKVPTPLLFPGNIPQGSGFSLSRCLLCATPDPAFPSDHSSGSPRPETSRTRLSAFHLTTCLQASFPSRVLRLSPLPLTRPLHSCTGNPTAVTLPQLNCSWPLYLRLFTTQEGTSQVQVLPCTASYKVPPPP